MSVVSLSEESKKLIIKLGAVVGAPLFDENQEVNTIERAQLVCWLKSTIPADTNARFTLESLRATLLEDLHDSFLNEGEHNAKKKKKAVSWWSSALLTFLALAGALVALCEGFDGIVSILGSFIAIPTVALLATGICFSFLSVGLFYSFELFEISKVIGVEMSKSRRLLDVYLEQVDQIDSLVKVINDRYDVEEASTQERRELYAMSSMLISRYESLSSVRDSYVTALSNPLLKVTKVITATMTSVIFFSSGFFAGQSLALTIASLFVATISATFWPIMLASVVVGLAAMSLYLFVQRPRLENLVSHWVGLDQESIDTFVEEDGVQRRIWSLYSLQTKISRFIDLRDQVENLSYINSICQNYGGNMPPEKKGHQEDKSCQPQQGFFYPPSAPALLQESSALDLDASLTSNIN